jgi:3-hydroxybutyryl-CoA dehydrogenase
MAIERVGVLGAGTMGAGIAQIAALGGYETWLYDAVPEAASAGVERLGEALAIGAARGRWSEPEAEAAAARVRPVTAIADLTGCELLLEAAPERLELKRELFAAVAATCGPGAVLATNTSSLRVAEIAAGVPGPERVVGMHFFNPPALMKLVEIVAAPRSSETALAIATEVGERMGRTPIRARDSIGFVANRLARPFSLESLRMLGEGIGDATAIDTAVRVGGGFRMGPFALIDLIGLDVNLEIARSFFTQGGEPERWRPSPIQERMVGEGKLGRKSSEGYFSYADGGKRPPDPDLKLDAPTLDPEALARIGPAAETILRRLFAQIANETAYALEEEIATPADMDTAMRLGLNWPRGPLDLAELIGAVAAVELLESLESKRGPAFAQAPLLRAAAEQGSTLRDAAP